MIVKLICLLTSLLFMHCSVQTQKSRIAVRFKHLQFKSDTGVAKLIHVSHEKQEDQGNSLNFVVELKQDEFAKKVDLTADRCNFEKSHCQHVFTWNFTNSRTVQYFITMKNQPWSTIWSRITPHFSLPQLKKNVYYGRNITIDMEKINGLIPNLVNNLFQLSCSLRNRKSELFLSSAVDVEFFEY